LVLADPEMASVFAPNGSLLREGDIVKMPKLSRTLELIAQNGSFAMYGGGPLTQTMVKEINAQGGLFTLEDIKDYSFKVWLELA
jgi:gamma-glutamyltranspeptidase / glutathione hydrolase / leukotriene-C4 hydrolase